MREYISTPPEIHCQLADKFLSLGMHGEALIEVQKVAPQFRNSPFYLSIASQVSFATGRFGESVSLGRALLKLQPENPLNWSRLAASTRLVFGNQASLDVYREASAAFPYDGSYRYSVASQLCALGRIEEAKAEFRVALKLAPSIRQIALDDPGLSEIWEELVGLI